MRALARVAARRALRGHASSALVAGEAEAEEAARKLIEKLPEKRNGLLLYLAKGYGARSECIGPLLHEHLGSDAVVLGCNSEGGVMAQGRELQKETFALAALLLDLPGLQARPFAGDLEQLPSLKRGGRWSSGTDRSALAFCSLPVSAGDPQSWVCMLDIALTGRSGRPPVLVGGMPVGGYAYVDGEMKASGAFGVVLEGASCSPVVCQGSEPFGPFMEITAVQQQHVIREINGQSPRDLLLPLLNGPQVPGTGSSMAGIFVDPKPGSGEHGSWTDAHLAAAALGGRPNCLSRPMHAFTQEGYLVLSPLTDMTPYAPGMQLQLQCFSPQHALRDLRSRAETDLALHGRPPDAVVMVSCGARGSELYGEEGVESAILREVWGCDVPMLGFFAGGEFGPVGLRTYVHGYTTSCMMIRSGQ